VAPRRKARSGPLSEPFNAAEADPRELAFYSSLLDAWVNTRMERDKSLFTLSTAAIGLLVTLLTTVGARGSLTPCLYAAAFLCFLLVIVGTLEIFRRNADHIVALLSNPAAEDRTLDRLDRLLLVSFALGVISSIALGASAAHYTREHAMQSDSHTAPVQPHDPEDTPRSVSGLGRLHPSQAQAPTVPPAPEPARDTTPKRPAK
jgi:hypothetical protein